ncbi:MAG: proline--tRNA ligase [Patescibacteria group bacterium]|nr:proline--tRNA ligase [Patescibacteria group bacterium]
MSKKGTNSESEKSITSREADYAQWYQDVIRAADLAENSPVKGCMIIKPNGYAIWENMKEVLDDLIKSTGVRNAYFPLLIPERFLQKEAEHVEGFAPEIAVVTHAGGKKLTEPYVVRPTSETIINDAFSNWIQSHRDLPMLINQWANIVRWEMRPRLFLRNTEFLWQEGHTAHATEKEADERALMMLKMYEDFMREYLAIPVVSGRKTENERFAGAKETYTVEAMMQDGKALQMGTSHNLGQNFAKAFDITFADAKSGQQSFVWQTSWGVSTRMIGGLVMAHSDDTGLVLPPMIAPTQVIIVPVLSGKAATDKAVLAQADTILDELENEVLVRVLVDTSEERVGAKFFKWEKQGIPLRIELGAKDMEAKRAVLVRRDTGEKEEVALTNLGARVADVLGEIQAEMLQRAEKMQKAKTKTADSWDEFVSLLESGHFVLAHWCGDSQVEREIQEKTGATIRCIPFKQKAEKGKCILTGKASGGRVVFAKAY